MKIKPRQKIAFDFVIEKLMPVDPVVRAMFGAHAIYVDEKIVLITRNKDVHLEDNGVWVGTWQEHHASLKKEIPSLRSIGLFSDGKTESAWQVIPADSEEFEREVIHACDLILKRDPRIGKIPKSKNKKKPGPRSAFKNHKS